jgi:predicted dinucleotide-binding enzyme
MRIGIIGSGRIGATAAKLFTRAGHDGAIERLDSDETTSSEHLGGAPVVKAFNSMYFETLGSEGGRRQRAAGPLYNATMTAPETERALDAA